MILNPENFCLPPQGKGLKTNASLKRALVRNWSQNRLHNNLTYDCYHSDTVNQSDHGCPFSQYQSNIKYLVFIQIFIILLTIFEKKKHSVSVLLSQNNNINLPRTFLGLLLGKEIILYWIM